MILLTILMLLRVNLNNNIFEDYSFGYAVFAYTLIKFSFKMCSDYYSDCFRILKCYFI